MRKEYFINGVNEAVVKLKYGKISLTAHFQDGDADSRIPAKFATENELFQLVIENSEYFGISIFFNGPEKKINLIKAKKNVLPSIHDLESGDPGDMMIVEYVKDINDAIDFFAKELKVPKLALRNADMIKAQAEKHNVKFPNLSL